jgi:epoxyqueuosine reductase
MPKPDPKRPDPQKPDPKNYVPDPALMALWPDVSGNTINGLGEHARRRPSPVFWHKPERIAHGKVQDYALEKFNTHPALLEAYTSDRGPRERPPKPAEPVANTPEAWTARLKDFALGHDADAVGIARLDPAWIYEGFEVPREPWLVMIAVEMDYEKLRQAPGIMAAHEVMIQYNRAAKACRQLAGWIVAQGYDAKTYEGPFASNLTMIPAAIAAGLGELGKHGSMINRRFGSSFRLSAVGTDMPLIADTPDAFGADDFCASCQVCTKACPPRAISPDKQWVRGEKRWYVDFDKCLPFFSETHGCAMCIAVCPWSRPGVRDNLLAKMARRRARDAAE